MSLKITQETILWSAGFLALLLATIFVLYLLRKPLRPVLLPINKVVHKLMLWIADVALLGMVILVCYTVTLRYVFNTGVGWAEEVPRLLVTLFAFLAMGMGVRDHIHIGVNLFYNLFPKGGYARRFMVFFGDFIVLLCGLFMLYYGYQYCARMYKMPGRLPMTGLSTWWQYLPIPMAGFVITFDSFLFLSNILGREELLYSEPEKDYQEEYEEQQKQQDESEQILTTQDGRG